MRDDACVIILFGASGSGKSHTAHELARRLGWTWMQADDLRIAFEFSPATRPEVLHDLTVFHPLREPWEQPMEELVASHIQTAEHMRVACETVIHSHLVTGVPMIIEGDCIHPDVLKTEKLAPAFSDGGIRTACLGTPSAGQREWAIRSRAGRSPDEERITFWVALGTGFGRWIEETCASHGVPLVAPMPRDDLVGRVAATLRLEI